MHCNIHCTFYLLNYSYEQEREGEGLAWVGRDVREIHSSIPPGGLFQVLLPSLLHHPPAALTGFALHRQGNVEQVQRVGRVLKKNDGT